MDLQHLALRRDGAKVDLSPHNVRILGYLASNPGKVISKEELLERFWPDTFVADNTLERSIARIRRALADNPANPVFIQTVARQGYRFIAPVDASGAPAQPDLLEAWSKGRLVLESLNAEELDDATKAFERVLAEDERYAPSHAAVANAYFLQYELTRPENTPNRALLDRALTHAQRARELDPQYGEAHATLGFLLTAAGEVEQARAAARRATMLQTGNWRHWFRLSMACWGQERLDAVDRTLALKSDFAPSYLAGAMVFVARQAFPIAEKLAAKGAALQSQNVDGKGPFPAFGLHWLLGLLHLRNGEIAKALESFDREVSEARPTSIYFREYRVNALIGAGYADLAAGDAAAAANAFRRVLETMPSNGRALLELQRASMRSGLATEAESFAVRESNEEMTKGGRLTEAAMLHASVEAARGNLEAACDVLERLLTQAPPGQTGWMIPLDPAIAPLRDYQALEPVQALLSARAS